MTPKQKANAKRKAALTSAVRDLLATGKRGRTMGEVALEHGCNLSSLEFRIRKLRAEGADMPDDLKAGAPTEPPQSLANQEGCEFPTKSVGNRGNERVAPPSSKAAPTVQDLEGQALDREVLGIVRASIAAGGGRVKCQSAADLDKLYELARKCLGLAKKDEGGKAQLIQVSILSGTVDSRARPERITESGNEKPVIEAETSEA
jgi:transposase-like protein